MPRRKSLPVALPLEVTIRDLDGAITAAGEHAIWLGITDKLQISDKLGPVIKIIRHENLRIEVWIRHSKSLEVN